MKVEIWSDVMCPFCYIGKRRFEQALEQFTHKEDIDVVWKSFQLNPAMKTEPGKSVNQYLADIKGWSLEEAREMNERVTEMAEQAGLAYDFDKAVVANSFDAHRIVQFAKEKGKGDEMEERLFKAYFTEGKNIEDHITLIGLATDIGLDSSRVKSILNSIDYADKVQEDVYESQQIGVRGVPFFLFNDRYTVSGAQHVETFAGALDKAWSEWKQSKPLTEKIDGVEGAVCTGEGCD